MTTPLSEETITAIRNGEGSNRQIAAKLGISPGIVHKYRKSMGALVSNGAGRHREPSGAPQKKKTGRSKGLPNGEPLTPSVEKQATQFALPFVDAYSMNLPDDLTKDQWFQLGDHLRVTERAYQWWIGDWLLAGDKFFDENQLWQALADLGFEVDLEEVKRGKGTFYNWKSVAKKVPRDKRRLGRLSFSHIVAVAYQPEELREELLDKAERENLNTQELRAEVSKRKKHGRNDVFVSDRVDGANGIAASNNNPPTLEDFNDARERCLRHVKNFLVLLKDREVDAYHLVVGAQPVLDSLNDLKKIQEAL